MKSEGPFSRFRARWPKFDFLGRMWVRLFLATFATLVVALVSVGLLTNYFTVGRFDSYLHQEDQLRDERLISILGRYFHDQNGWQGSGPNVDRLSVLVGERLVLTDASGKVVADSAGQFIGKQAGGKWSHALLVKNGDAKVGTLYVNPTLPGRLSSAKSGAFIDGVNRSLWFAFALAGAFSVAISLVLAQTLVRPLASVMRTARHIGRGDLSLRVETKSSGELGELAAAVNSMAQNLQRDLQLRRQLVADVAHELRTPLQNVCGYLEALGDGVVAADDRTLSILTAETDVLKQLVNDLQDLSLAESGSLTFDLRQVDAREQVEAVVASMERRAEDCGVTLDCQVGPDLPAIVADERRLRQVVANLVSNAIKYTPAGGKVWITAKTEGPAVQVTVSDSGPGISKNDIPFIFERFFRVDRARARATGGAGLGLTIARELIQAMHGSIGVVSREGEGSHFWIRLPRAQASVATARASARAG